MPKCKICPILVECSKVKVIAVDKKGKRIDKLCPLIYLLSLMVQRLPKTEEEAIKLQEKIVAEEKKKNESS